MQICINKIKKRLAITLPELMIALVLFASCLLPISGLMGYGSRYTQKDAHRIAAIQLLEKTARALLAENYNLIPIGTDITSFSSDPQIAARVPLGMVQNAASQTYNVVLTCEPINTEFAFLGVKAHGAGFNPKRPINTDFYQKPDIIKLLGADDGNNNGGSRDNRAVKKLTITVSWQENNRSLSVSAFTYRANFERRKINDAR